MASIRRHQMLSLLPRLSLSLSVSSYCHRNTIILAVVHQSASQSYESFSFTFRFRFQSICLAFLAVPPSLPFNLFGDLPRTLQFTSEWAVFGMLFVCFFFCCCCSWFALSILCSVFKAAAGKQSRANTSSESRCLLHF